MRSRRVLVRAVGLIASFLKSDIAEIGVVEAPARAC
jgi:hypothetical protein